MSATAADRRLELDHDTHDQYRLLLHRGLCFVIVVAVHSVVAWTAIHWRRSEDALSPSAPAVVMMELAPLPAAPVVPPAEIPPGPKQEVSEPPPPEPDPVVEPILPPMPPTPAPKVEVPVEAKPKVPPPPKPLQRVRPEPPRPRPEDKPPAPATTAPQQVQAPPAPTIAAPASGVASATSGNAVPTWQAMLIRRLEQFRRYPASAQFQRQQGVAYLRFTMNRDGRVLSAQISKSSGFALLDEETLALVHRAEPLPPPPPSLPGNSLGLVVPIEFFLSGRR